MKKIIFVGGGRKLEVRVNEKELNAGERRGRKNDY